ncbi:MAG TPA: flagellar hook capping FlgD N-terminal domain-containing protein [Egibacteraceae bacterium]|nr:flagellar hook capping FlgD N-terminal domain-containing protein [Egibacteraceae bacterium]
MPTIGGVSAAPVPTTASALGGLDSQAFLKLLVAQLRYQNPMAPSDPSAMLQQTAQFTQIETLQQIAAAQQQMLGLTQVTIANDLVGSTVLARVSGEEVRGTVDGIRFTTHGPVLLVGDREVPLHATLEIHRSTSL